ncbi:unnamed protein product, partial [Ectocarpus sp. 13 AM-2016]
SRTEEWNPVRSVRTPDGLVSEDAYLKRKADRRAGTASGCFAKFSLEHGSANRANEAQPSDAAGRDREGGAAHLGRRGTNSPRQSRASPRSRRSTPHTAS